MRDIDVEFGDISEGWWIEETSQGEYVVLHDGSPVLAKPVPSISEASLTIANRAPAERQRLRLWHGACPRCPNATLRVGRRAGQAFYYCITDGCQYESSPP